MLSLRILQIPSPGFLNFQVLFMFSNALLCLLFSLHFTAQRPRWDKQAPGCERVLTSGCYASGNDHDLDLGSQRELFGLNQTCSFPCMCACVQCACVHTSSITLPLQTEHQLLIRGERIPWAVVLRVDNISLVLMFQAGF